MDAKKLRAKMVLKDIDRTAICNALGISKSAYHRKMNGESDFRQGEIERISTLMDLNESELLEIFFDKKVS